jgi:hypothetical protein
MVKRGRGLFSGLLVVAGLTLLAPVAHAGVSPLTWAPPVQIDHQPPYSGNSITAVSCPTSTFCVAADFNGDVVTSSNPTSGATSWTVQTTQALSGYDGVSCVGTSLCVIVDAGGGVTTSTNPASATPAWSQAAPVDVNNFLNAVSCVSTTFCVAADSSGNVVISTNPTGGVPAWAVTNVDGGQSIVSMSCASTALCVGGDLAGDVVASTNPTGGAGAWTVSIVDSTHQVAGMSCPSTTLCVGVDNAGNVLTSSAPAGGAGAWTVTNVDTTNVLTAVSCNTLCAAVDASRNVVTSSNPPSGPWTVTALGSGPQLNAISCPTGLCVAGDTRGAVVTSTNPTGGAGAWTPTTVDGNDVLNAVSCASSALCVAGDASGNLFTSTNPTGGAPAWTRAYLSMGAIRGGSVSCPTATFCAVAAGFGNVLTSTNPTAGAAAWTSTHADTFPIRGISCPTTTLCVAVDSAGNAVVSTNPTGGAAAWSVFSLESSHLVFAVSCTVSAVCVAVDIQGNVIVSSNPTGGAGAWSVFNVDGSNPMFDVSCAGSGLCAAGDGSGNIVTSTNPTSGASWSVAAAADAGASLDGMSCPSSALCVATDSIGNAVVSTNPTGGAAAWNVTHIDGSTNGFLYGVSCPTTLLCVVVDQATGSVITGTGGSMSTLTTLGSSANPANTGNPVTYTASVSPIPDGGTVAFTDNSTTLSGCGAVAVNITTGQATCTTTYSSTGSHSIVANYSGDVNFAASSGGPFTQIVHTTLPAQAVLPAMANNAYGGYTTVIEVQNIGTVPANVDVGYFDGSGSLVGSGDSISALPAHATWTVRQDNGHSFASGGAGSAVVSSSQPVAAFVNEFAPGGTDATSYTGINSATDTGTTLYAPAIARNAYGGYTTGIGLINFSGAVTNITVTYRDANGAIVKTQSVPSVPAGAYQGLYSGDATLALPDGFAGTATITSSAGALAAIVNETGPGGQFSSYDATPTGSTTLYAPAALDNAYGGYNTGLGIVNTTGVAGTVSITYYDSSGTPTVTSHPIAANGYVGVYQPNDLTVTGPYTAKITSTVAVAAIVNEVAPSANPAVQQSTAYNTFAAGSSSLHLPLVESAGSDGWSTGEGIMNTGLASTAVTVNYYDTASGAPVGTPQTQTLAPHAFWGLFQPTGGLPSGARATAVINTSSGGQVAVICNESNATSFMSYNAQ